MPAANTPASTMPPSQLAAQAVHQRFAHRPSLFSVVFNALRDRMLEHYPTLEMDLRSVKLASPHPSGGWEFQLLINVAVEHVLNPQLLDLSPRHELPFYLTQKIPSRLKIPEPPYTIDMQVIADIIAALPSTIHIYFQQALADYWSATDAQGISHWQWLGEFLNGQMTAAASRPDLAQTQRDMLSLVAAWPEHVKRSPLATPPIYASFIETTLIRAGKEQRLLTPDLLLVRDQQVLLYSVAGAIETFDSIDAFSQAWGIRMQHQFQFDSMTWRRNEPDANVFEQQAALILNRQLEDLGNLTFQGLSERSLERRLDTFTDPALLFATVPEAPTAQLQQLNNRLPEWIKQASADDRFAYHRHLQDLAQVLKQNQGRSFNEGIENIHDFSRDALRKQMQTDHGDQDPDDVVLDFSVAAGYPGGAGFIEHERMSLTELALKNLAGKPKGTLKLSSKSAKVLPGWLDEAYVLGSTGLIQRVDIGTAYPQKINDLLLSDTADARRRETLFIRELKVRLPTQALEFKIRNQYGVSATGYRYVKALLGETVSDRTVDGQEIVLRPLALCRKVGAGADTVNNIFIIEPRDTTAGPHLLYRPLYADSLHQYPTRQALLDAIAAPGDLQNSVLTWLNDKARPTYDHGGIKEPHLLHFLNGDEFGFYEKPAPATLAVDTGAEKWLQALVDGKLFNQLFVSTAQALVDLADQGSVSNSESRWAIVMEGAWLLFNSLLLPLVRGPAMLAGWFLVFVSSLEQDTAGLDSNDPTTRELALIDLLLNTAMVLLHAATPSNQPRLAELAPDHSPLDLASWRRSAGVSHPEGAPVIGYGPAALPGEPPAAGHTALDFSRSIASPEASKKLFNTLLTIHVPWPDPLPKPEGSGTFKGLYRFGDIWHASVGGLLFQVSIEPGFGDVYLLNPKLPHHPGFKLASDGLGHWRLDRKARLNGGMPRGRVGAWQVKHNKALKALQKQFTSLMAPLNQLADIVRPAEAELTAARKDLARQAKKLRQLWLLLPQAIEELREVFSQRHDLARTSTAQARVALDTKLAQYRQANEPFIEALQAFADKAAELSEADRTDPRPGAERSDAIQSIYDYWTTVFDTLSQKFIGSFDSEQGESRIEIGKRCETELPQHITTAYNEYINSNKTSFELLIEMIEPAEKIETLLQQADPALQVLLLKDKPTDKYISPALLKQAMLVFLNELVMDRGHVPEPAELPFADELTDSGTRRSIFAHSEMRTTTGYSTAEKIDVLKNVLERYERLENAVSSLTEMGSGFVREEYRTLFLEHLSDARSSLETQLADEILIDEGFAPEPRPEKPTKVKTANKKVIKTSKGSLVGDLRTGQTGATGSFVDIKDPTTGQTVATFEEDTSEGLWKVVTGESSSQAPSPEVPPVPVVPSARSLKKITAQAQEILDDRARIERRIRFQQKQLHDPRRLEGLQPWEWDHMLTTPAMKLESLAREIQSDHATNSDALQLAEHYLGDVESMKKQAREFCSEGYLLQRPRASNIKYLLEHKFVIIDLVKTRFPLKAGDFLTEYAVHDKSKIKDGKLDNDKALWYAHFHYASVDAPISPPAYAHLKIQAERKYTQRELFEKNKNNARAIIDLKKEEIPLALAEELFLRVKKKPEAH
ncbi:hypothetical protein PS850_03012 [Pseudomonas fluorescens]|nr:hypothetical protein PS850_03012 [Pseudomonas fluorescens]